MHLLKKTQVVLFNIGKCTVNMHKQSTTVFLLTKINKDLYINVINALLIHKLTNVNKWWLIVKCYQFIIQICIWHTKWYDSHSLTI